MSRSDAETWSARRLSAEMRLVSPAHTSVRCPHEYQDDGHVPCTRGRPPMTIDMSVTVLPILVATLSAGEERMPVYVYLIDHPHGRILVDTGLTELHPAVADMDPRLEAWTEPSLDLDSITAVVNTHLHFDHCGGNHLFAGKPVYVQRRELEDARSRDDYTIREWVDAPGVRYVEVDGELETPPGVRLLPSPGHTRGSQIVVVETDGGRVVIAGDTAVWFGEIDQPTTQGQRLIRSLDPDHVWLAHVSESWAPRS